MKVYCYKDNKYFTVGKWYELFYDFYHAHLFVSYINKEDNKKIRSDEGFNHTYYNVKQYFLTMNELREQKLKRLING
jgi:hypothetical protein